MGTVRSTELARTRASAIWRVRSGAITASQAAQELGVSRKTYYEWEARAMQGMLSALQNQPAGRPAHTDSDQERQKQQLQQRIEQLQQQLATAEQSAEVRSILEAYRAHQEKPAAQGERKKKRH